MKLVQNEFPPAARRQDYLFLLRLVLCIVAVQHDLNANITSDGAVQGTHQLYSSNVWALRHPLRLLPGLLMRLHVVRGSKCAGVVKKPRDGAVGGALTFECVQRLHVAEAHCLDSLNALIGLGDP